MAASYGWSADCCQCGEPVGHQQKRDDIHDVCFKRETIRIAIEALRKADDYLATAGRESWAGGSVEDALSELSEAFEWAPPQAKPSASDPVHFMDARRAVAC